MSFLPCVAMLRCRMGAKAEIYDLFQFACEEGYKFQN